MATLTCKDCIVGLCLFLLVPTGAFAFAPRRPAAPTIPISERHSLVHSHNDYDQPFPLFDAIAAQMDSVEADIWLRDGELVVSHWASGAKGTLEMLYLDPLRKLIESQGTVHGDGKPFYLWIEIKESQAAVVQALADTLNRYSFLSTYTDTSVNEGPVSVILTGDRKSKARYVNNYSIRRAIRDYDWISESDPPADNRWQWYAINWYDYFKWSGYGAIPDDDKIQLEILVRLAHSKGRKVRLFGTPEEEDLWNQALIEKVDMIGTDELTRLHKFVTAP